MLIDWFTVVAQALNFVVLVWLMKRFLYAPVLGAIAARETRVAAVLADAAASRAQAQEALAELQRKNEDLDEQRAALLAQAAEAARSEGRRLEAEARASAEALQTRRAQGLRDEAADLQRAIGDRVRESVFSVARGVLAELADASVEARVCEVFIARMRGMAAPASMRLGVALRTASAPAVVRSGFELSAPQRAAIRDALAETFDSEVRLRFETAPALIAGIELVAHGQKLTWSIDDYLGELHQHIAALVDPPAAAPQRTTAPTPAAEGAEGADGRIHEPPPQQPA